MAEDTKTNKIMTQLYKAGTDDKGNIKLLTSTMIGEAIGENPLNVGKLLNKNKKRGLCDTPEVGKWKITDEGRAWLESGGSSDDGGGGGGGGGGGEGGDEGDIVVPTNAVLLKEIGEKLRIGVGRGGKQEGTPLDAIIYFVEKTADLEDLTSVWNALTKMGVAGDIKKRWIELYAQNVPGKEMPEELKNKIEAGTEGESLTPGKGDIVPKPKRFSIVGDQIIGDPEGDFTFKEALQLFAQQKGVPAAAADPLAGIVEAMKVGPEMATTVLTSLIPLITKEPAGKDNNVLLQILQSNQESSRAQVETLRTMILALTEDKHKAELESLRPEMATTVLTSLLPLIQKEPAGKDNVLLQILQSNQESSRAQVETLRTMILALTEDRHKAEMESLRAEMRTGQRAPESDARIEALSAQVRELTDSLHQKEIDNAKEQNQRIVDLLQGDVRRLEQQIAAVAQGKKLDGSLGLMEKAMETVSGQLTGIRTDVRPLVETMLKSGAPLIPPRNPEEKRKLAQVGKEVIARATRAEELEHKIIGA